MLSSVSLYFEIKFEINHHMACLVRSNVIYILNINGTVVFKVMVVVRVRVKSLKSHFLVLSWKGKKCPVMGI